MKLILAWLLMTASLACAQTLETLQPLMKKIHESYYNMDFGPIAAMTYPTVVEQLGGSAKFEEKLDHDHQNEVFRKRIQLESVPFTFGPILETDGKKYCVITYRNPMRYFIEKPLDATSGPKMAADLKAETGAFETIYEPKRNTINVKRNSKFIAIADETTQGQWKFIDCDDLDQLRAAKSVLNKTIKTRLGI